MITEDYVSFETAKLLEEKGFVIPYDSFRGVYINGEFLRRNPGQGYLHNTGDEIIEVCSLQMAMKWLREVHNIDINIYAESLSHKKRYTISIWKNIQDDDAINDVILGVSTIYEEACEAAIKYCLENLI